MQKFIRVLQKRRLQTSPNYWAYSVSGNIIELKIIPTFKKEPEKYRIGVIQAGSIIQYFRLMFMDCENPPLIQIFPSIMENELIAIIRFSSLNTNLKNPSLSLQKKTKKDPLQIDQSLFRILELPQSSELIFIDIPKNSQALCIFSENPFTWLTVGYQAEIIQDQLKQKDGFDSFTSYLLKNKHEQLAISSLLTENLIPQIVLFIND
ncbi:MAG: hypothetical protein WD381_08125 [Balneolaceae bacterium]